VLASASALAISPAIAAAQPDASAESKIVTFEQKVAMNFEQWPHVPDEWEPPTNAEWAKDGDYLLPFVRMAWLTLFKTKTEVETIAETLDDEPFEILVNGIIHSREFFENFVKILNAAEVRITCAANAVELSAGPLDETS
jgi:hypothetical protein